MLNSLYIENFAIIDKIDVDFTDGLNIITGETGSGKSILIEAFELLLGQRFKKVLSEILQKNYCRSDIYNS